MQPKFISLHLIKHCTTFVKLIDTPNLKTKFDKMQIKK